MAALAIAEALDADLELHGYDMAVSALRHNAFELACTNPGILSTHIAIQLGARPPIQRPGHPKPEYSRMRNAMQIAGTRPADELVDALDDDEHLRRDDPEFGLLLSNELVLRTSGVVRAASWYRKWAERTSHPLAALPDVLLDIEREMPSGLPRYSGALGASSWPAPTIAQADAVPIHQALPGVGQAESLAQAAALSTFQDWLDDSNGRVEVAAYRRGSSFATFRTEPRIHPDTPSTLIESAHALRTLFIASVGGGAYSPSPGGAMARLRVWTALTALLDFPSGTPIKEVAEHANDARWLSLDATDPWFDGVAWDIWIVMDAGERVVTVAATDTD